MPSAQEITTEDLIAAVRVGYPGAHDVRIRKRRRLRPTAGLTGSY